MSPPLATLTLVDAQNQPVSLDTLCHGHPTLFFCMRHLGCGICRRELLRLRGHAADLAALNCAVIVVVIGDGLMVQALQRLHPLPFPVYGDPTARLYTAFDMGEGSLWTVAGPHVLLRQFRVLLTGIPSSLGMGSIRRLGGIVALDRMGTIVYHHVANPIYHYPPWTEVLAALAAPNRTPEEQASRTEDEVLGRWER
jgi:peroxiredoxin